MAQQPPARMFHTSVAYKGRVYMWGGRTVDWSPGQQKTVANTVYIFDTTSELWLSRVTTGPPHPGLYRHASLLIGDVIHFFGGSDGKSFYNSLHQLDLEQLMWRNAQPRHTSHAPMRKANCGMASFGQDKLVLFAGYGFPSGDNHEWFMPDRRVKDGRGWCNELHLYDTEKGTMSYQSSIGTPPPCSHFSLTNISATKAIVLGRFTADGELLMDEYCLLDMESWTWNKLVIKGPTSPVIRRYHTACILCQSPQGHPQLLVSGGMDGGNVVLGDHWILEVDEQTGLVLCKEITCPKDMKQNCFWHTTAVFQLSSELKLVTFGGCTSWPSNLKSLDEFPKLANTELSLVEAASTGEEWVLTTVRSPNPLERALESNEELKTRVTSLEKKRKELLKSSEIDANSREKVSVAEYKIWTVERRAINAEQRADAAVQIASDLEQRAITAEKRAITAKQSIKLL